MMILMLSDHFNMNEKNLTQGSIAKTLILFAVPFFIASILQALYGAVDMFVIGYYCDAKSSAAVSTGTQVTQIVTSLMTGLTLSSTILIGDYVGKGKNDKIKETIGTSFTAFFIFALLLTVVMLLLEDPLLRVLRTPEEAFELTKRYVTICLLGNVFICGYNAISAVLRGYGDSKSPMVFVGISCIINIILDFTFVKYLHMNVEGTALATIISQGISMFIAVAYLKKKDFIFSFRLSEFRVYKEQLKRLLMIGIPVSAQEIMIRISFLYLTAVMNNCGVAAAAVVGIGSKYDVFAMLAGTSMANALAAITAQNMGAGRMDRARKSLWYGMSMALFVSIIFWLWAQLNPEGMIGVFTNEDDIINAGIPYFKSCSYDYILVTMVFCLNGYLNGCQKTVWTMVSSCFGALVLRIPMVYVFSHMFGSNLLMLGTIAPTVSGIMALYTLVYVVFNGKFKNLRHNKKAVH